jgi:hypothetical protein
MDKVQKTAFTKYTTVQELHDVTDIELRMKIYEPFRTTGNV